MQRSEADRTIEGCEEYKQYPDAGKIQKPHLIRNSRNC